MTKRRLALGLGALAMAAVASTATIETIDVDRDDDVYNLYAETMLDASPEAIRAVLIDYERFGRISSVYKEYGYLEPQPDGTPTVFTTVGGCLMGRVFCREMTRVERLEVNRPGHIRTVALPAQSDFKRSVSEWIIEPEGDGSRMIYTLELEPDFWIPPVIGPWYLKRTLLRGGGDAIDRIESLAQDFEAARGVEPVRRIGSSQDAASPENAGTAQDI